MISNVGTVNTTCSGSSSGTLVSKLWKKIIARFKQVRRLQKIIQQRTPFLLVLTETNLMCVLGDSHIQSASTRKAAFASALPNEYRFTQMPIIRSDG
jgi:hypothetical protein